MILVIGEYKFEVVINDLEDGVMEIYIGSASRPCVIFLVFNNETIILQDLMYHSKCSSGKPFVRRSGATQIMVKGALQWLCDMYPKVKAVDLTDKMKYEGVIVPERMFLTEGQTWYQKHFQALPETKTTAILYFYKRVYEKHKQDLLELPLDAWKVKNIKDTLSQFPSLYMKQITGTGWYIPRNTIIAYDIPKYEIRMEGGSKKLGKIIQEWNRNWEFTPDIWRDGPGPNTYDKP